MLWVATPGLVLASISFGHIEQVWRQEFGTPPQQPATADPPASSAEVPDTKAAIPTAHLRSDQPHPAVVRIVVPEQGAISYGSGSLVDVREKYGLVITNWHVVRDAVGDIEVLFPGGFTSKARALKVDPDWDLAALVIWRPQIEPLTIAAHAPQPGEQLTICGYGPGIYRSSTGTCTQYYAPKPSFPQQMVELDVQARQGDSGGPIFNSRGELAGVLFGAGEGTTLGSFGGRVDSFLASLAPDIGRPDGTMLADSPPAPTPRTTARPNQDRNEQFSNRDFDDASFAEASEEWGSVEESDVPPHPAPQAVQVAEAKVQPSGAGSDETMEQGLESRPVSAASLQSDSLATETDWQSRPVYPTYQATLFEKVKNVLAAIGVVAIALLMLKAAG